METQRLNLLADRFGARIQEWGQPRDRVKHELTVAGQAKTFKSSRWRPLPVSLPKNTDIGVLAPGRGVVTEEARSPRMK